MFEEFLRNELGLVFIVNCGILKLVLFLYGDNTSIYT